MQKKGMWAVIIVVVVVVAAGAVYMMQHKKSTTAKSTTSSSSSSGSGAIISTKSGSSGSYLVDANGAPLYTYGGDSSGVSTCTGSCVASWPAYEETASSATLPANVATITRSDDHNMQYTYKGLPLYTFASDSGSTPTGDGVGNFQLARP